MKKKAWHKSLLKENKDDFNQNTVEGNKGLLTLSLLRGSPLMSKNHLALDRVKSISILRVPAAVKVLMGTGF